jgi:16S rRNA (guanine527-N7)-methyltransferase
MPPMKVPNAAGELLAAGLDRIRGVPPQALAPLEKYIAEIELFNPAYGLVKVKDREELALKHILDSLAPLPYLIPLLPEGAGPPQIADVGSGAGLPGIPLAICLPEARFTLIERMGRRAGFLRDAAAVLGLSNTAVEEAEMEKAAPGRFSLAVFRAFRPLEKPILKGLLRLLAPGGVLAAWKGRRESALAELAAAEKALPELAGRWELAPAAVPFLDEERHLVIIRNPVPG